MSVWWIENGIRVEFIAPGSPQQNGSHERMHRDLKAEVARRPSCNLSAQQKSFDRWRHTYNHERPHEALDMLRPAEVYRPSQRYLGEKDSFDYPANFTVRRMSQSGYFSYECAKIFSSEALAGCRIGLLKNEQGIVELHYANLHLGNLEFRGCDSWRRAHVVRPKQAPPAPRG